MQPGPAWPLVESAHAPLPSQTPVLQAPVHSPLTSSLTSFTHACDALHFSHVAHPWFVQQCDSVPLPPAVQTSTQVPVAGSQRRLVPHVTPVQSGTQLPDEVSHFCPLGHVTPVQ